MRPWWILLLLVPVAQGLDWHAIGTGDELLLTEPGDPRSNATMDTGQPSTQRVTWAFRLDPRLSEPLHLDGSLQAVAVLDSQGGGASVQVGMTLEAGNHTIQGRAQNVTLVDDRQSVSWSIPVQGVLPAGPVWWNVTAEGPLFLGLQMVLDGESTVSVPDVPPPIIVAYRNVTLDDGPVTIVEGGDGGHAVTRYMWPGEGLVRASWQVEASEGTVRLVVPDVLDESWTSDGTGAQNLTAQHWNLTVERQGFVGSFRLQLEPIAEPVEPAPRARESPAPWLPLLWFFAWAARSPRSGVPEAS